MKNGYYYTASLGGKRIRVAAKYVLVLVAALAFTAGAVIGALVNQQVIPNTGRIVIVTPPPPPELELQFFEDENCTIILSEINWGDMDPGETKGFPAYVKNVGDVPFTMNLSTQNWDPADAEFYLDATWDYKGTAVEVKEVRQVTFELYVVREVEDAEPKIENFAFDIVILATQA